ncbi:hypothetical protein ACFX19_002225 [Malus domestica]
MQVMTTGATLIDEQLAHINEAIARLTRIVEEKNQQIAALVNQLDVKPDVKIEQMDDSVKKENDEDEEPSVEKIDVKPEPGQAAALIFFYPTAARDDRQHHQGTIRRKFT